MGIGVGLWLMGSLFNFFIFYFYLEFLRPGRPRFLLVFFLFVFFRIFSWAVVVNVVVDYFFSLFFLFLLVGCSGWRGHLCRKTRPSVFSRLSEANRGLLNAWEISNILITQ